MNRMLINATQQEELRVALVDGQYLYDLDIERAGQEQKKANIYKGRITRIEPSLEAAFVDYGGNRHGFLPLKEISRSYFHRAPRDANERVQIREVLREGQEIMVQIDKEERGNKGAALTTFISLAGCYLVLMPNNPRAGGISRRIEGEDRDELRDILNKLVLPEDMGVIVRTAGVGKSTEELQWDLDVLIKQWTAIKEAYGDRPAPFLIHQESDVIIRSIRDYLRQEIHEILVDHPDVYTKVLHYVKQIRPDFLSRVKQYTGDVPLFSRFQIEKQIESAYQREVRLPSGGAIVIDYTEALVSIDINSSRATKGGDIEETALNTNSEAAREIARQLRLRDLGGLIVIDFIDMTPLRNQREVENQLRDALRMDRARVQIGRISRFGLLEMSRQRLRPSIGEASLIMCPRCSGHGSIRSVESLSLSIVRLIEEEAIKEKQAWKKGIELKVQVPVEIGTYLLNEKRADISSLEKGYGVSVLILPNPHLKTPHYSISKDHFETDEEGGSTMRVASYKQIEVPGSESEDLRANEAPKAEAPAVKMVMMEKPSTPAPPVGAGVIKRFFSTIFGSDKESKQATPACVAVETKTIPPSSEEHSQRREGENSRPRRHNNQRNDRSGGQHREREQRPQQHERSDRDERNERGTQERTQDHRDRNERSEQPRSEQREGGHRQPQHRHQSGQRPPQHQQEYQEQQAPQVQEQTHQNEREEGARTPRGGHLRRARRHNPQRGEVQNETPHTEVAATPYVPHETPVMHQAQPHPEPHREQQAPRQEARPVARVEEPTKTEEHPQQSNAPAAPENTHRSVRRGGVRRGPYGTRPRRETGEAGEPVVTIDLSEYRVPVGKPETDSAPGHRSVRRAHPTRRPKTEVKTEGEE